MNVILLQETKFCISTMVELGVQRGEPAFWAPSPRTNIPLRSVISIAPPIPLQVLPAPMGLKDRFCEFPDGAVASSFSQNSMGSLPHRRAGIGWSNQESNNRPHG